MNAREDIEIYQLRAAHYIERKNFMIAEILMDSAMKVYETGKYCHLQVSSIRDSMDKFQDASFFQQSMTWIENHISVNQYHEALIKYMELESFFSGHAISRFGLTCETVFDYVKEKTNPRLTLAAIKLFMERAEYQKASEYLKLYRLQDGNSTVVKKIQKEIMLHTPKQ